MRLFLVRHGETQANASGVFYGSTDLPLTPQGEVQSRRVAGWLSAHPFAEVIASGLRRAQDTARIIVGETQVIGVDARLNELDFGEWEMRHYRDIAAAYPQAWQAWTEKWQTATPPGGESFAAFLARVRRVADEIGDRPAGVDRLVVAHQGVLSLLLASWLEMPPESMWRFPFSQEGYSVVENRAGYWVLRRFNSSAPWHQDK